MGRHFHAPSTFTISPHDGLDKVKVFLLVSADEDKKSQVVDPTDRPKVGGLGLETEADTKIPPANLSTVRSKREKDRLQTLSRNLIEYFARLGRSTDPNICVDLDYIESLIQGGASLNCTDKYGQTVLHEVK